MTTDAAPGAAFRQDIQGLRAIAVLLVLVFHLWPSLVPGGYVGVDVFFVISGYLITAHLVEHPPSSRRDLAEFWGRRIRRLLPAAFLVLAATLIGARLLAPETQWAGVARGVIASALYVENWALASSAVDYMAATDVPTATQHYWSLSVEEQFYVLWPILILAVAWLARRANLATMGVAKTAIGIVVGVSIAVSIQSTATEPASTYFVTPARVWELAAGGIIATLPSLSTIPLRPRHVDAVSWVGLVMMLVAAMAFTTETQFPGAAALVPVIGSAMFIAAATQRRTSPTGLLRLRPIQHVGDTSYSIYLWHWPLIALAPYITGSIGGLDALANLAATLVLATLTKTFIEDGFRFAPTLQPLVPTFRFAVVGMAVVVGLGGAQLLETQFRTNAAVAQIEQVAEAAGSCFGAAAIVRGFDVCPPDSASPIVPQPVAAKEDRPDAYADNCWVDFPFTDRTTCTYGDGALRVALVGNSHAGEWLPALQVLATTRGWTLTTFIALQCNVTSVELRFNTPEKVAGCLSYGQWVMDQTTASRFDLVVTSQRQSVPTAGDTFETTMPHAVAGYLESLERWRAAGVSVVVLQDTPYPWAAKRSIPDCLAQNPTDPHRCDGTQKAWYGIDPLYQAAEQLKQPGVTAVPTRQWFCASTICPAVIGNVVVYFDGSHMTATYARTLVPYLDIPIEAALRTETESQAVH